MMCALGVWIRFLLEGYTKDNNGCFQSTFLPPHLSRGATSGRGNFAIEENLDLTSQRESDFFEVRIPFWLLVLQHDSLIFIVDIPTIFYIQYLYFGLSPCPVTVTTRIIPFLVGNPYKPSFVSCAGRGTTLAILHKVQELQLSQNHMTNPSQHRPHRSRIHELAISDLVGSTHLVGSP